MATTSTTLLYFRRKQRKIESKELPSCSVPYPLITYNRQLEILAKALLREWCSMTISLVIHGVTCFYTALFLSCVLIQEKIKIN